MKKTLNGCFLSLYNKHLATKIAGPRSKVQNTGGPRGVGGGKLFACCKLIGATPPNNQCQIITFFTLKTNNLAKLRIESEIILLEIPSTK